MNTKSFLAIVFFSCGFLGGQSPDQSDKDTICQDAMDNVDLLNSLANSNWRETLKLSEEGLLFESGLRSLGLFKELRDTKQTAFDPRSFLKLLNGKDGKPLEQLWLCRIMAPVEFYGNARRGNGAPNILGKGFLIVRYYDHAQFSSMDIWRKCSTVAEEYAKKKDDLAYLLAGYFNLLSGDLTRAHQQYEKSFSLGIVESRIGYLNLLSTKGERFSDPSLAKEIARKTGLKSSYPSTPIPGDMSLGSLSKGCRDGSFKRLHGTLTALRNKTHTPPFSDDQVTENLITLESGPHYKDLNFAMSRHLVLKKLESACSQVIEGELAMASDPMAAALFNLYGELDSIRTSLSAGQCHDKEYGILATFDKNAKLIRVDVRIGEYSPTLLRELDSALTEKYGGRQAPSQADIARFFRPSRIDSTINSRKNRIEERPSYDLHMLNYYFDASHVRLQVIRNLDGLSSGSGATVRVSYFSHSLAKKEENDQKKLRVRPSDF